MISNNLIWSPYDIADLLWPYMTILMVKNIQLPDFHDSIITTEVKYFAS